jgi:hypothetical protein
VAITSVYLAVQNHIIWAKIVLSMKKQRMLKNADFVRLCLKIPERISALKESVRDNPGSAVNNFWSPVDILASVVLMSKSIHLV